MNTEISRGDEVYTDDVFEVLLEYEISRTIRYPAPLSLLFMEITSSGLDGVSSNGASKVFTRALNRHLRSVDIPSGSGNSYKILLPTTSGAGLRSVCERLLSIFKTKFTASDGRSIAFTLNIGATSHAGGKSLSRSFLFENAQAALKRSKLKGPNTYVIHP
jgi:hypothetical protein